MPDLHTALQTAIENSKRQALNKTLEAWDKEEKASQTLTEKPVEKKPVHHFKPTNNITRITYDFVRDNPDIKQPDVVKALVAQGHKEGSVASLCSQFVRQGLFARDIERRLRIAKQFTSLKSSKSIRGKIPQLQPKKTKKEIKPVETVMKRHIVVKRRTSAEVEAARAASGIETLAVAEAKSVGRFKQHTPWSPDEIVNTLNVMQARQLYDHLKNLFGG